MKGGGSPSKNKCRQGAQQCDFVRKQQDLKRSRAGCRRKAGGCQGWNHSSCTSRSCEYGVAATAMLAVGVRKQQSKGSRRPPGSTRLINYTTSGAHFFNFSCLEDLASLIEE